MADGSQKGTQTLLAAIDATNKASGIKWPGRQEVKQARGLAVVFNGRDLQVISPGIKGGVTGAILVDIKGRQVSALNKIGNDTDRRTVFRVPGVPRLSSGVITLVLTLNDGTSIVRKITHIKK